MRREEPFNYLEHKIKDAAEKLEIVFVESSWKKMEGLLDNEPRRKPFVWWWFVLPVLTASGLSLFLAANELQKKGEIKTVQLEKNIALIKIDTNSFTKVADSEALNKIKKIQ